MNLSLGGAAWACSLPGRILKQRNLIVYLKTARL